MDGFDYGSQSKDGSAIGVSVYVNVATHDTQAVVADTARIYSKDLNVEAGNELVSVTLGASGGQAKTVAVNGVVLVNVTSATTVAQVARGATVAATGTASIQARDATWVGTVAGAAAGSQTVGVGMSVAINDVNRDTQALIGQWRDDATPVTGAAGSFSAGKLLIGSENKGFVGNLAVSGSRVSSPVAGAGDGTGAGGAGGTAGGGTDVLGTKAPASQGGATPGKDSAAPDPDELLSLSDILKELSNSTSTLTQDSGSGSGSGGGGSQQQSKAGVAISGAVAVNMVNDFAQAYINAAGLTITIGGDATISATNGTHALALSGAVALAQPDNAKTNVGIAGAYSMNGLGGEARAEVALVGSLLVAGDLALSARRTGVAVTLAAGMAGAKGQKGVALAGSAAVTTANYGNIALLGNATKISARGVKVEARDSSVLATVAGSGAVTDGKAGVGAAVAVNISSTRSRPASARPSNCSIPASSTCRPSPARWRWASPARWAWRATAPAWAAR